MVDTHIENVKERDTERCWKCGCGKKGFPKDEWLPVDTQGGLRFNNCVYTGCSLWNFWGENERVLQHSTHSSQYTI